MIEVTTTIQGHEVVTSRDDTANMSVRIGYLDGSGGPLRFEAADWFKFKSEVDRLFTHVAQMGDE